MACFRNILEYMGHPSHFKKLCQHGLNHTVRRPIGRSDNTVRTKRILANSQPRQSDVRVDPWLNRRTVLLLLRWIIRVLYTTIAARSDVNGEAHANISHASEVYR